MMRWAVAKPQKLATFLQRKLTDCSGKALRRALEASCCRVNGKIERFATRQLVGGETVEIAPTWRKVSTPEKIVFETVFENDAMKIVNKPAGWVCDEKAARKELNAYLVHRLDKGTSGLLILAKTKEAKALLEELFAKREVKKVYWAVVDGHAKDGSRKSFLAKKRVFEGQTIWGSSAVGLSAETYWKVLAKGEQASLVECEPVTGRTHQIRVHMAESSHPILFDRQYAMHFRCKQFFARPLLHARRLQFVFQGETIDIEAKLPRDMQEALKNLKLCNAS